MENQPIRNTVYIYIYVGIVISFAFQICSNKNFHKEEEDRWVVCAETKQKHFAVGIITRLLLA